MNKNRLYIKNMLFAIMVASAILFMTLATLVIILMPTNNKEIPKTTQHWLNDFQSVLIIDKSLTHQKFENKVEIWELDEKAVSYTQICKVDLTNKLPKAHLIVEEEYHTLKTTQYNIHDEYFLCDGIFYIKRITDDEEVTSDYAASIDIFWDVVHENIGGSDYNFDQEALLNLSIIHTESGHSMSANVLEDRKNSFLGDNHDFKKMNDIRILMQLDQNLKLVHFQLEYYTDKINKTQKVIVTKRMLQYDEITSPDWISSLN
ncbi:MAG: hypothetical protein LBE09_00435 [Christensenellaceae bacterium]|jgi:hypothetical protein|nr:hypothetical protein [Christensenellaceae bacterium]